MAVRGWPAIQDAMIDAMIRLEATSPDGSIGVQMPESRLASRGLVAILTKKDCMII